MTTFRRVLPRRTPATPLERWVSEAVFVVGLGLLLGLGFWYGRGLWFYSDEWNIVTTHFDGNFLQGFNGQWLLIPVAIFWGLLRMFGMFEYLPFRVVGLIFYGLAIVAFHRWALRRVRPAAATVGALAIAWYSTSWNVVMMPLLMNFTIPVAMLFFAWNRLDSQHSSSDRWAALCLLVGVLSSNVGLIVIFMVGVEFLARRESLRRWWVLLPSVVIWVPWYLFRYESVGPRAKPLHAFHWGLGLTENYARGFTWGWRAGQWVWLAVLSALLIWALVRRRWNPRSIAILFGIGGFVVAGSFRFADFWIPTPPNPNWYLWFYSVLVMTLIVETLRDTHVSLIAIVAVALVIGASGFQLQRSLGDFRANGVSAKGNARAWFAAADALGPKASPDALLKVNLVPVRAGDYARLRKAKGTLVPGVTLAMLGDEPTRQAVDSWMLESLGVALQPSFAPDTKCQAGVSQATWTGQALLAGTQMQITTHAQPATVRIRRFAGEFSPVAFAEVEANHTVHLSIPADNSSLPWMVYVDYTATTTFCTR